MYYPNRAPRKRNRDYFMPFFIIVVIIAIIIFGWRTLNQVFIDDNRNTFTEKVFLNIENGSAKAMTVGSSDWDNAPDNIYLYKGEKIKTGSDGRVSLTFTDQSIVRMDSNAQVDLIQLNKKNEATVIEASLVEGQVWTKIERINNPDSRFTISTELLVIDSRGGDIGVVAPGTVYVLDGTAQISIKYDDEIIKTVNLGVGQQFVIDEEKIGGLNEDSEPNLIFALSDSFKSSEWYRWNMKKDGAITAFEESDEEDDVETSLGASLEDEDEEATINPDRMVSVTKPSPNSATASSTISIEGLYDPEKVQAVYVHGKKASNLDKNKWKISKLTLAVEGENELKIEAEDLSGVRTELDSFIITYDKTPPATPVITDPGVNDETVTIEDIEQIIEGTVSKDTYVVIVNDYRLSKYVPGSKEFAYYAKTAYGNLEVGENEYEVFAEDKAGNVSDVAKITLVLDQEVIDEAETESDDDAVGTQDPASTEEADEADEPEPVPASTSEGGVTITEPNGGESFTTSETEFDIKGAVPVGTATVEVNNYKLSLFEEGDTTFRYTAKSSFGNLEIGEANEFTVKAFDADGKVLGTASITIDVEGGTSGNPTITMPSTTGLYSTTLNELVIGGDVGKWTTKVYVNDEVLSDYIPGSEKWRKTVTLTSGDNTFNIKGEGADSVSITITYTQ